MSDKGESERQPRYLPPAKTRESLDQLTTGADGVLMFYPVCCGPTAGVRLVYKRGSGLLRVLCARCGQEYASIRVERADPQARSVMA